MTFPSTTLQTERMMDSAFFECDDKMLILLDSLTHRDISGMQAQQLIRGTHIMEL